MWHTTTRLVLVYRNESFIPNFPGAHSPEEEEVKSKDISIIQWTEYFRTSKYWLQWGPRAWECLGSVFIRAIKALWKEICSVCVCSCVCAHAFVCSTLLNVYRLCGKGMIPEQNCISNPKEGRGTRNRGQIGVSLSWSYMCCVGEGMFNC